MWKRESAKPSSSASSGSRCDVEKLRLKNILTRSFTRSELTNFDDAYFHEPGLRELVDSLKSNECIAFMSVMKDNIIFVRGDTEILEKTSGKRWRVLGSRRVRIRRGPGLENDFEPLMLVNYARSAGIELIGLELFEEHLVYLMKEEELKKLQEKSEGGGSWSRSITRSQPSGVANLRRSKSKSPSTP